MTDYIEFCRDHSAYVKFNQQQYKNIVRFFSTNHILRNRHSWNIRIYRVQESKQKQTFAV